MEIGGERIKLSERNVDKEICVIVDYESVRLMAWIRLEEMINSIVYLDSYNEIFGEGSMKHRNIIMKVLKKIKEYEKESNGLNDSAEYGSFEILFDDEINLNEYRDK